MNSHPPGQKIGLALGSGSARGLAHIGVLRAIQEQGLSVHAIAGSSIGALIGASFASGHLDALEAALSAIDRRAMGKLLDPTFRASGIIRGKKIIEFLRDYISPTTIEELRIPFCAVATDIATGEEVSMLDGSLIEAVRSSFALPGLFTPVRRGTHILADGGLVDPVPVEVVRRMGADVVIAVDLNHHIVAGRGLRRGSTSRRRSRRARKADGKRSSATARWMRKKFPSANKATFARVLAWREKEDLPSMLEVMLSSLYIMQARITDTRMLIEKPDVLIRPPVGSFRLFDFDRADELIDIGYQSALAPIRELAERLASTSQLR